VSLVSEALKKAEREAAAREQREKGLPAPLATPLQPYRARRQSGGPNRLGAPYLLPILALLGTAAVLVIAVQLARPREERKDSIEGATEVASASVSASVPDLTSAAGPRPASAPTPAAEPSSPAGPSASEATSAPQRTLPLPKTTSQPPPAAPSASESQPSRAAAAVSAPVAPAAPAGRRTGDFLRSVEFPDGTKLELGGIVYSEAAPFAYLNGRLVGVGEFVEGFRIDRIEREQVLLSGDAGSIRIRLK
jgi:hypothetical protein